jgi:teichuronic acid biosynthesis glycosyltransferase TuaH
MVARGTQTALGNVGVISLERWDDIWRRNQHLAARLFALGLADHVTFINPAGRTGDVEFSPVPGVTVVSLRRWIPKRLGGLRVGARSINQKVKRCDTLWINDATTGVWLSHHGRIAYDVTDDWRCAQFTPREVRRLVSAENVLSRRARTIVCSEELRRRWQQRYDLDAVIVRNAADVEAIGQAQPRDLGCEGPHVGYVGTLHEHRLDVELVLKTADAMQAGRLHLVGPDCLSDRARARLSRHPRIALQGAVAAVDVPSWLVAFDVLICPHVVTPFTLSLDAIKAYEYLATPRPVVATPTSGFQELAFPGLVVSSEGFPAAVMQAVEQREAFQREVPDWNDRTRQFAAALLGVDAGG